MAVDGVRDRGQEIPFGLGEGLRGQNAAHGRPNRTFEIGGEPCKERRGQPEFGRQSVPVPAFDPAVSDFIRNGHVVVVVDKMNV